MTMYATLEEAIDAAREEFLADNPGCIDSLEVRKNREDIGLFGI